GLRLVGIAMHIGSQLTSVEPYRRAFGRVVEFARMLASEDGHRLERLDFGGGLGVHYERAPPVDLASYAAAAREAVRGFPGTVVLEPGRWMVADAGILVARVQYVKRGSVKTFVILDAAMNDL